MKKLLFAALFLFISNPSQAELYIVDQVINGNTLKLKNGQSIRLIGVDVPDSRVNKGWPIEPTDELAMGQAAKEFVETLLKKGEVVRLEYDNEKRDNDGNILAYAYLQSYQFDKAHKNILYKQTFDDLAVGNLRRMAKGSLVFLNATIIKAGYAKPVTAPPPIKHTALFQALYQEAKENKRGVWAKKSPNKYLANSLYCRNDKDCAIRGGACGPEPMNVHFDNSKLIEMRPYVECSDYIPLKNPQCLNSQCVAEVDK